MVLANCLMAYVLGRTGTYPWMDDRLEGCATLRIGEDDRAHPPTVQVPVRPQHVRPELGDHRRQARCAGLDDEER